MTQKFSELNRTELTRNDFIFTAGAVLIASAIYLTASYFYYGIGFPLDDSWIHQTYARNLALHGEWSFRPGILSAGSTAPLWSALLSIGFLIHLSPYIWTYLLGALVLFTLSILCEWTARKLVDSYRPKYPLVAFLIAFEWHFTWAAMSGMETLLHGLILTTVLVLLMTNSPRYLTLGLLTGLSVWVRPDGLTLLGPVFLVILLNGQTTAEKLKAVTRYLIGFGSLFVPYLLFNLYIGGTPMPNTFYAKQAEYIVWQSKPILERVGQLMLQLLAGSGLAFLPGCVIWFITSIKERNWSRVAVLLWFLGYVTLYIIRLPVYQHGRYIMPAMPIFYLTGIMALFYFVGKKITGYGWILQSTWSSLTFILTFAFVFVGAKGYAEDVGIIESEMVVTAKWAAANLPKEALLAVHDIGALGFFDDHAILDLAGLVSPQVVPFIRDEARLSEFLSTQGADYLIAFPDFYPKLTKDAQIVFVTHSQITLSMNEKNMAIYLWKP